MTPVPGDISIARASEDQPEAGYNRIFELLVNDEQDNSEILPGLVGYALYKQAKKEWAADLWDRRQHRPSADELAAYVTTWTPSRLSALQSEAEQILAAHASAYIDAARPEIREAAIRDEIRGLHNNLTVGFAKTRGFGSVVSTVLTGILSAFLYTLLLILIAYVIKRSGIDLIGLLR